MANVCAKFQVNRILCWSARALTPKVSGDGGVAKTIISPGDIIT